MNRRWMFSSLFVASTVVLMTACSPPAGGGNTPGDASADAGPNYENRCDGKDNDDDGVEDDGCAVELGFDDPVTQDFGGDGTARATGCGDGYGVHEVLFQFTTDYWQKQTLYGTDYQPGNLMPIDETCGPSAVTYPEPTGSPRFERGESIEEETDEERYANKRFSCGPKGFVAGFAGAYDEEEQSFHRIQAICRQIEIDAPAEQGEPWPVRMTSDTRRSPCWGTDPNVDDSCEPLVSCPEGMVLTQIVNAQGPGTSDKVDSSLVGLHLGCAKPSSMVVRSEDPYEPETLEPIEFSTTDG